VCVCLNTQPTTTKLPNQMNRRSCTDTRVFNVVSICVWHL